MRRLILPLILVAGLAAGTAFALGPASSPGPRISASVQAPTTTSSCPEGTTLGVDGLCHGACPIIGTTTCRDESPDPPTTTVPEPTTTTAPVPPPTTAAPVVASSGPFPSTEWFYELGRCEQPGSGEGGVDWTAGDSTYGGGLGFYRGTWDAYRGEAGIAVEEPEQATPAQQIAVGRAVFAHHGAGAWGCSRSIRAPY